MTDEDTALLLLRSARTLWDSVLIGNAPSKIRERADRMSNPQVGDWVFEASTSFMLPPKFKDYPAINKVGTLVKVTREPIPDWEESDEEDPNPGEKCIYIKTIDGREYRWTNARVVAFLWD